MLICLLCTCARFWGLEILREKPWGKICMDNVSHLSFFNSDKPNQLHVFISLTITPSSLLP